jgi:hypothetical protein
VLEGAWRRGPERDMVLRHGLIQWVVALEHHRRGNPHGARVLLGRSWAKLAGAREGELGLEWAPLKAAHPAIARAFARWDAGGPRPEVSPPPLRRRQGAAPGSPRG